MDLNQKIAEKAMEWVKAKVPYRHRGMSRRGADCTGLLIGVMQELGYLKNYKLPFYSIDWCLHKGRENIVIEVEKFAVEVPKRETKVGDVVLFKFGRCNAHAGILVEPSVVAHSYLEARKCMCSVMKNSMWEKRWVKTYRFDHELASA